VARHALALEHLDDLRRLDAQMRVSKRRIADAIAASGTSLTEAFGVGPVVAAMVIGYTGDVAGFHNRDHFAAYTGTAPIEVSSGRRITHRLSRRGNRQLNHALHIGAITQIRYPHSQDRAFFERKVTEGKTRKKPCVRSSGASPTPSTTAPHRHPHTHEPGRATGDDSSIQRGRLCTPTAASSYQPLPGPDQR
jgi:transposase